METASVTVPSAILNRVSPQADMITMYLASSTDPLEAIMKGYDKASDKDEYVAALAFTCLLRHRQWQAACGR